MGCRGLLRGPLGPRGAWQCGGGLLWYGGGGVGVGVGVGDGGEWGRGRGRRRAWAGSCHGCGAGRDGAGLGGRAERAVACHLREVRAAAGWVIGPGVTAGRVAGLGGPGRGGLSQVPRGWGEAYGGRGSLSLTVPRNPRMILPQRRRRRHSGCGGGRQGAGGVAWPGWPARPRLGGATPPAGRSDRRGETVEGRGMAAAACG
ncbi:hypothetical protein E2C01_049511 [Portunus trituberculatus]|uniref:Uncharacterized protein n=1 Tax=Portunus trituberculatus TaxID=210409 RepID=A0A5B7G5S9_PORTR|nr:hypothetical protein [Portunus trituberculatus]